MNIEDLEFTESQKAFIFHAMRKYIKQLEKSNESDTNKTYLLLEAIDEVNNEAFANKLPKPSCTKGCSHCCHIRVAATEHEVDLILENLKFNNLEFDADDLKTLEEQSKIQTDAEYITSPHRKCVFLQDDGLCGIYQVRPSACRNYYVFSDPEDCNTYSRKNISEKVLVHFDINTLPMIGALMELSPLGMMSQLLLKKSVKNETS